MRRREGWKKEEVRLKEWIRELREEKEVMVTAHRNEKVEWEKEREGLWGKIRGLKKKSGSGRKCGVERGEEDGG